MDTPSLDHVYFWTGDLDRAVAYYRDVLGLRSGPTGEIPLTGRFGSLLDPDGNGLLLIEYSRTLRIGA